MKDVQEQDKTKYTHIYYKMGLIKSFKDDVYIIDRIFECDFTDAISISSGHLDTVGTIMPIVCTL